MTTPTLTITLLGGFRVTRGATAVSGFVSRKAEALLVYLLCHPRPLARSAIARDTLAALFWSTSDQSRALANLSVALSSIRKQLEDKHHPACLQADRTTVAIHPDLPCQLDVRAFEEAAAAAARQQEKRGGVTRTVAALLETAVAHYRGDFLAGFSVRGAPEFEAWALLEQERLRQMATNALSDLTAYHLQRGQAQAGITTAGRLLALDPLIEEAHRQLMQLYALDGQRSAALAQFDVCAAVLEEELGVSPAEETWALFEAIKNEAALTPRGDPAAASPPGSTLPRHNLPAAATTFLGREAELARIDAWLADVNGRLLTIVGPGGVGKTRLAQQALHTHADAFADGVWYVSLVPLTAAADLAAAIADTIGLSLSGSDDLPTQLANSLADRELLLLLDNFEHLLSPASLDLLTALVASAPELKLIVTSRQRLNLHAETVLELTGLPYPGTGDQGTGIGRSPLPDPDPPILGYAAVQLFANRAARVRADFSLAGRETAVVGLCRLVDGLPLALELAATWLRVLPLADIIAEIESGLDILATTMRDLPARHRSLRAVFDYSWRLLPPAAQDAYARLAVFRGGFTRAAAAEVADATLPLLTDLVDKSFLRLDNDSPGGGHGIGRYKRHPLLIQYAAEQLVRQPALAADARRRHAAYFGRWLADIFPAIRGEDGQATLDAVAAELENIRAAWQWALAGHDYALINQLMPATARFFADRSRYLEGTDFFTHALEMVQAAPAAPARPPVLAALQEELGYFLYQNGRYDDAHATLTAGLALARAHELTSLLPRLLKSLGSVCGDQGKREEAARHFREALPLSRRAGDEEQTLFLLSDLAHNVMNGGDFDQAEAYFAEAMVLAEKLGNPLRVAVIHNGRGILASRQEDHRQSIHYWELARQYFEEVGHDWGLAVTSHNIGIAYLGLEAYEEARDYVTRAYRQHEKLGHRRGMVGGLAVQGTIYRKTGKHLQARRYYNRALALADEVGVRWAAVSAIVDVGELALAEGDLTQAAMLFAFASAHEATEATTRENAANLLAELEAELPPEATAVARQQAANYTLSDLIAELLAQETR